MLEIGRIRFRPLKRDDLHLIECWENTPECTLYARGRPLEFKNKDDIEREYEEYLKDAKKHRFIIEMVEDDKVIGFASYKDSSRQVKNASIGAFIGERDFWNLGLGKEITLALCEMLFFHLNYDRVSAWTSAINHRAKGVLESLGFVRSGTSRKSGYLYGKRIDWYMYDLLREEYIPKRQLYLKKYVDEYESYIKNYCTLSDKKHI